MRLQMGYNLGRQQVVIYHRTFSNFLSFQHQIECFFMSLEAQNKELQMFFELQKQRNKVENTHEDK
jgi:hypothetical protein